MAKFKRDEARSFGFLWLLTGGIFAVLSAWAMYNEIVVRTPWRDEQKEFFKVELDQAKRNLARQESIFKTVKSYDNGAKTGAEKLADLQNEQKAFEGKKAQEPYASAANELKKLNDDYATAEQKKTFAKSDLDEAYYYRTLADYDRDESEGKARAALESRHTGEGRLAADKAFLDPPLGTQPSECPPKVKAKDNCADLLHIENEIVRNKSHESGSKAAGAQFPDTKDELAESAKKAREVLDRLEKELGHQKRIDAAVNEMLEIDEKRQADKAKMAPVDDRAEELEREIAKVNRPIEEAQRRLKTAEERANPKFDVANVIGSLVGIYEINQLVTDWNGTMQVDRCTTCHMGVDSANYGDLTVPRKFRTHPMRSALFNSHPVDKFGCTSCHQGQGRATESMAAHSVFRLQDHAGGDRWELTGDEFWEDPMLQIGDLVKIQIDARNDTFEADVGTGRFVTFQIPRTTYAKEVDFFGQLQMMMQQELLKSPLATQWRVRVMKIDNRVNVGLEALNTDAETMPKKPAFRMRFTKKPELADVLGFANRANLPGNPVAADGVLKCQTWCSAVLPPTVPVRFDQCTPGAMRCAVGAARSTQTCNLVQDSANKIEGSYEWSDPIACDPDPSKPCAASTGEKCGEAIAVSYQPPSGRNGMQVPPAFRDRFIQSLPETQSSCMKCHAGDSDLRPHKSKAQYILAQRDAAARAVQVKACAKVLAAACDPKDPACAKQREECTKLTTEEPPQLGDDPEKMPDLAPTLVEGRNLFKRLNCTGCHILDGFPGNRNAGPSLNNISSKVSAKWLTEWIRYPRAWRAKTRMPTLWPVPIDPESKRPYAPSSAEYVNWETRMRSETLAIAAYLWDRSEHPELQGPVGGKDLSTPPPPQPPLRATIEKDYSEDELAKLGSNAQEGQKIFETIGCKGCHAVGSDEAEPWKARERDIAPNLGNVGNKMSVSFMAYWVENPSRYWHGTRMPNLRLSKAEAGSVAMFLAQQKNPPLNPARVDDEEMKKLADDASRKELASKGALLIANYGCFGCHQIAGFEAYAPIAPELNGFSHKDVHTLDYGYAITDHHQKTWETFVVWKLDSPRIYATDRIELRMGDYDLSPREITALTVFLKGLSEEKVRPELYPEDHADYKAMMQGKDLVEEYNCKGCHSIEGLGNEIQATIKKGPVGLQQSDDELSKQYGPPSLSGEGLRVQPEWLYQFISDPGGHPIRPFLHPEVYWGGKDQEKIPDDRRAIRMPTFPLEAEQITSIIRYFSQWDGAPYPYQPSRKVDLTPDQKLSVMIHLNSNEDGGVRCVQCHYVNVLPRERALADWKALAPNLANAPMRLRPEWVKAWVENPKDFLAYTKMPPLWTNSSGDPDPFGPAKAWTKPPGVKYENGDEQIAAFRDFLFTLKPDARLPEAGKEEGSPLATGVPNNEMEGPLMMPTGDAVEKPNDGKDAKDAKDKGGAKKPGAPPQPPKKNP